MIDLVQMFNAVVGAAIGGIRAYIAIRTDLANLKARMENTEKSTDNAHERIDKILMSK
jgi:hypothetical protein